MNGKRYVYALIDPRDGIVRYIGVTSEPGVRLLGHYSESKIYQNSDKDLWISDLLKNNLKPAMMILSYVNMIYAAKEEIKWIAHYREISGEKLLNQRPGGEGIIIKSIDQKSDPDYNHAMERVYMMTSQELKNAMEVLNLTQGELARRLEVRPETVYRWVRGHVGDKPRPVPGPVAVVVNLWLKEHAAAGSPV